MKTEIKPFSAEMIPLAGNLLSARHKRNRAKLSLLPERFEDSTVAGKAVEALWQKKFKNGYAAFRDGKMTAYLIGDFTVQLGAAADMCIWLGMHWRKVKA